MKIATNHECDQRNQIQREKGSSQVDDFGSIEVLLNTAKADTRFFRGFTRLISSASTFVYLVNAFVEQFVCGYGLYGFRNRITYVNYAYNSNNKLTIHAKITISIKSISATIAAINAAVSNTRAKQTGQNRREMRTV